MMNDKQYISETILKFVLKHLDDLKPQATSQTVNADVLKSLVEQAQQQA